MTDSPETTTYLAKTLRADWSLEEFNSYIEALEMELCAIDELCRLCVELKDDPADCIESIRELRGFGDDSYPRPA